MSAANYPTPETNAAELCGTCGLPHKGLTGYNHNFVSRHPTSNQVTHNLRNVGECLQRDGLPGFGKACLEGAAEIERLTKALRISEIKASGTLANNLCPDHRDKQVGKPCLACEIERLTRENERYAAWAREYDDGVAADRLALVELRGERDRMRAALDRLVAAIVALMTPDDELSCVDYGPEREGLETEYRNAVATLSGEPSPDETTADCSTGTGGVTLAQMAENIKHGVDPYTGDQMDIEAIRFLAAGQDDPQSMALAACANEIDRLRAKSNSRPEGLIRSEVAAEIMDAIDELIKPGKLQGSGWDETAQRNGLILAYNTISQKFGEYRAPEASPLKASGEPT